MKRTTILLLLLAWILGLAILTGQSLSSSLAQGPKAPPKWHYATLVIGDSAVDIYWSDGKTKLESPGNVTKPNLDRSLGELYPQLGGKDANPTLGMLLNLIGENGWEMVSYAHTSAAQVWMFKRPLL